MGNSKRGLGKKRCVRKSVSITSDAEKNLNRLSIATGLTIAEIMNICVETGLSSPGFIMSLQDHYNKNPEFRCTPIVEDKKIILV